MSHTTDNQNEQAVQEVPVCELYLSHVLESDRNGILITSITGYKTENRRPLKLNHPDDFGLIQLSYKCEKFHEYFSPDATLKLNEILLKKSPTTPDEDVYSDSAVKYIITERKDDCQYLFEKAIEDNYTTIIGMEVEIIEPNKTIQKLMLYLQGVQSPLIHYAVTEKDIKIIEVLLKYKLDINAKNKEGWTALHVAIDSNMTNVVDFLINNGADVNAQNNDLASPLHFAAKRSNLQILESLLKNQANLDKQNRFGETPLMCAVAARNADVVDILLKKGANYKIENHSYCTPFHLAVKQESLDVIKVFLENNVSADLLNSRKQTPLFYAVDREACLKTLDALLEKGVNINCRDIQGRTPLHLGVITNNCSSVKTLLNHNADVTIQNNAGENVLHLACQHQANKCIKTLLECGNIDINAVDERDRTALHLAVKEKDYNAVEMILQKNPNLNLCDYYGKTPLDIAIELKSLLIVDLLLSKGANMNLKNASDKTAVQVSSMEDMNRYLKYIVIFIIMYYFIVHYFIKEMFARY